MKRFLALALLLLGFQAEVFAANRGRDGSANPSVEPRHVRARIAGPETYNTCSFCSQPLLPHAQRGAASFAATFHKACFNSWYHSEKLLQGKEPVDLSTMSPELRAIVSDYSPEKLIEALNSIDILGNSRKSQTCFDYLNFSFPRLLVYVLDALTNPAILFRNVVANALYPTHCSDRAKALNSRDSQGHTALHIAAKRGDIKAIEELLSALHHSRGLKDKTSTEICDALFAYLNSQTKTTIQVVFPEDVQAMLAQDTTLTEKEREIICTGWIMPKRAIEIAIEADKLREFLTAIQDYLQFSSGPNRARALVNDYLRTPNTDGETPLVFSEARKRTDGDAYDNAINLITSILAGGPVFAPEFTPTTARIVCQEV